MRWSNAPADEEERDDAERRRQKAVGRPGRVLHQRRRARATPDGRAPLQ
jgi:hypothetical protein